MCKISSPAHHILALFELPSPIFGLQRVTVLPLSAPPALAGCSTRSGRAQLQLATAPQGRTPVLGVSGSGHMDEGGFEEPILHAETKAKIPGPPELSRADLARQKGPSTVWPLPETLNTFGRDCAQQNLDDGEGPVLGRQPASQKKQKRKGPVVPSQREKNKRKHN